ncbi:DNA/RNA non-specific endonuclease [Mycolicibacterium brisbanense]
MSAVPASSVALPTRSEIENWNTTDLADAAASWRTAATESEDAFDQHRQNISAPGGTTWEGIAKDAALDRVTNDIGVVGSHGAVLREAATLAENGSYDIEAAKRDVLTAIKETEDDGFKVGEDLSVTDTRRADLTTLAARRQAADLHAEDIRWNAERLVAADAHVGERLKTKAAELEGIRFEGEDDGHGKEAGRDGHVRLASNEIKLNPQDQAAGDGKDRSGAPPAGLPQVGPFPVPKEVADAAKKPDAKAPDAKTPDPTGLGGLLGADDPPGGKPGEGHPDKPGEPKPGLPPALSQLPPRPDQATIDRQVAKVDAARQALAAAEAKANGAAAEASTQGAGAGPSVDDKTALGQAVFDARRELTEQTKALNELNGAIVANGGHPVPIPPLPENVDVQAYPPKPSAFAEGSRALSEGSLGIIPDVANDLHTINNWDQASGADKLQAGLDAAGLLPIPGSKLLGEGLEHALPGFIGHHLDDVPVPHGHPDAPPAGHVPVDSPVGGHAPVDPPPPGHAPADAPPSHTPLPDDGLNHVSAESGGPGAWNQDLNHPAPLTHYTVDDRFSYTTDADGRVNHAEMTYDHTHEPGDRNTYQQRIAGGDDRLPGDHGGHIFGTQFGGPGEGINITAMRDTLNAVGDRDYYNLEQQWRAYADAGGQVQVKVDIAHPEGSMRPETYSVETYVDGQLKSTYHFDN